MKTYKPKQSVIDKWKAGKAQISKYKRIEMVSEVNSVIPVAKYKPTLKELLDSGLNKTEAMEVIDRVDIHKRNGNHRYSSQLRHIDGNPIAVRKELSSNPEKGLKKMKP
jgi:hypothetical protein